MKKIRFAFCVLMILFCLFRIYHHADSVRTDKIRNFSDTIGYARTGKQLDSIMARINRLHGDKLAEIFRTNGIDEATNWKTVIVPHDDHTYGGYAYPAALTHLKAPAVIFFGVAHRAHELKLRDRIIFDSYEYWKGIYKPVKVSPWREEIISDLPSDFHILSDSMQSIEHSVEAILPFLQTHHEKLEIISILVPFMSYDRMEKIAAPLAESIGKIVKRKGWQWGKDFAFIISNDAVHYGDQGWGGSDMNYFGTDSSGYRKALSFEREIIDNCLTGEITPEKIKKFTRYTVSEKNYMEYKWTWCGRYSVPFGLFTSFYLKNFLNESLEGVFLDYKTSIDYAPVPVEDIGLGCTAPAHMRHWVGYAVVGYK